MISPYSLKLGSYSKKAAGSPAIKSVSLLAEWEHKKKTCPFMLENSKKLNRSYLPALAVIREPDEWHVLAGEQCTSYKLMFCC